MVASKCRRKCSIIWDLASFRKQQQVKLTFHAGKVTTGRDNTGEESGSLGQRRGRSPVPGVVCTERRGKWMDFKNTIKNHRKTSRAEL